MLDSDDGKITASRLLIKLSKRLLLIRSIFI